GVVDEMAAVFVDLDGALDVCRCGGGERRERCGEQQLHAFFPLRPSGWRTASPRSTSARPGWAQSSRQAEAASEPWASCTRISKVFTCWPRPFISRLEAGWLSIVKPARKSTMPSATPTECAAGSSGG